MVLKTRLAIQNGYLRYLFISSSLDFIQVVVMLMFAAVVKDVATVLISRTSPTLAARISFVTS